MLMSGWHPATICQALFRTKGVSLSFQDVCEYRDTMLERKPREGRTLGTRDVVTDPVQDLHQLVTIMQERARTLIEEEKAAGSDASSELREETTRALNNLFQKQSDLARLLDELGLNFWAEGKKEDKGPGLANQTLVMIMEQGRRILEGGETTEAEYREVPDDRP